MGKTASIIIAVIAILLFMAMVFLVVFLANPEVGTTNGVNGVTGADGVSGANVSDVEIDVGDTGMDTEDDTMDDTEDGTEDGTYTRSERRDRHSERRGCRKRDCGHRSEPGCCKRRWRRVSIDLSGLGLDTECAEEETEDSLPSKTP